MGSSLKAKKQVKIPSSGLKELKAGADLGKILTVLLTTERRRRKNLGGSGEKFFPPRKIFSILIA